MKFLSTIIFTIVSILSSGFYELDTQASSLGGAGVTSSPYFNSSVLANRKSVDFSIQTSAGLQTDKNSIDILKDLQDLSSSSSVSKFNQSSNALLAIITSSFSMLNVNSKEVSLDIPDKHIDPIKNAQRAMQNVNDIKMDASARIGLNLNMKNYSLAWINYFSMVATPQINNDRTDIIYKMIITNNLTKYIKVDLDTKKMYEVDKADYDANSLLVGQEDIKQSKLTTNVVYLSEIPLTYSYRQNLNYQSSFDGYFNFGLSIKYMLMKKKEISINFNERIKPEDYISKVLSSENYSSASFDIGFLYSPKHLSGLKTGLTIKNITSPKFDDKILKPTVKYGLEYSISDLKTAIDFDITKNKTLSNKDTQVLGGGLNYSPSNWFGVSLGAKKDLANEDLGTIITTGFNLSIFNLSAQYSEDKFYQLLFSINT